jgi:hypothetical protein
MHNMRQEKMISRLKSITYSFLNSNFMKSPETHSNPIEWIPDTLVRIGELDITATEKLTLLTWIRTIYITRFVSGNTLDFVPHPHIKWISVLNLDINYVPQCIREKVQKLRGVVSSFSLVVAQDGVPYHEHRNDTDLREWEFYILVEGWEVILWKERIWSETTTTEDQYALVYPWQGHQILPKNDPNSPVERIWTVFFSIKYTL